MCAVPGLTCEPGSGWMLILELQSFIETDRQRPAPPVVLFDFFFPVIFECMSESRSREERKKRKLTTLFQYWWWCWLSGFKHQNNIEQNVIAFLSECYSRCTTPEAWVLPVRPFQTHVKFVSFEKGFQLNTHLMPCCTFGFCSVVNPPHRSSKPMNVREYDLNSLIQVLAGSSSSSRRWCLSFGICLCVPSLSLSYASVVLAISLD